MNRVRKPSSYCVFTSVVATIVIAGAIVRFSRFSSFMGASSSNMNAPVVIVPKENATASLIFLHGLGDSGHGWAEMFKDLKLAHIRCVLPHAPIKPVTLNGGMAMPSWFDIKGLTPNSPEDEEGIKESAALLKSLISKEVEQGIPPERIVIGGFSQGGAVALYTALGTDTTIGGLLVLSSWLPMHKHFTSEAAPKYNHNVSILQCHGEMDPMVPYQWGVATSQILKALSPSAQFKSYPGMGHSSNPKEMQDVKAFLEEILKES